MVSMYEISYCYTALIPLLIIQLSLRLEVRLQALWLFPSADLLR